MEYRTESYSADISVGDYIERFRDPERFIEMCKQCRNYGRSWGCPPFDFDEEAYLRRYRLAHLMATKIIPLEERIPIDRSQELILPERRRIEADLLELERRYDGRAFAYVGKCLYCRGCDCARIIGRPCRHPDKVRPSLEAFGFDIGRTLEELFGIELHWGRDGFLPDYLVLVSAFFHNSPLPR